MSRIDFDRAFPKTPECVDDAIHLAFQRGARASARRRRVSGLLSVAAALVLLLGAGVFAIGHMHQLQPDVLPLRQPDATPTPVPSATITPQLTDTPAPMNEEASVYCTQGGKYYHSKPDCSGMADASPTTIEKAEAMGKAACPRCIKNAVYCTQGGKYYHSEPDCSGMQGAMSMSAEKAEAMGKTACPACIESWVFYTPGGVYYHINADCSGMQNASVHSLPEALSDGKRRCGVCIAPSVSWTLPSDGEISIVSEAQSASTETEVNYWEIVVTE